jgi:hypothetical protein
LRLHSYPSIYNLGHRAITSLLDGPVLVEEKVDGSQFSFGVVEGQLLCRSKGADLQVLAPEKMFTAGVETAKTLAPTLREGWVYRGEYLAKPKHNTLCYDRIPKDHVILFDICPGLEQYLSPEEKAAEAERIGLEVVRAFHVGKVESLEHFRTLLDTVSVLGGQKIEGVVIKPLAYDQFGTDKKVLMGKFVSEHFKEVHAGEWKKANPSTTDVIQSLIIQHRTPARWAKALQHLREVGEIEDSPRDIGKLFKEVPADVLKEQTDEIKDALFKYAWPHIARGLTAGLPDWYKDQLLQRQFSDEPVPALRAAQQEEA